MKTLSIFLILITLISCSSYINQIHNGFDKNSEKKYRPRKSKNNFDFYRGNYGQKANRRSNRRRRYLAPKIRRNYIKKQKKNRRSKDYDLNDNGSDGSLWVDSRGSATQLFTQETRRKIGDIVIINVFNRLKNEITSELKRAFPSPRSSSKSNKNKKEDKAKDSSGTSTVEKKAQDKISAIIVEEINKSHILLRGRKNLLYRNRKHLVEIQALVSRKNITLDDTINSTDILESEVNIIR